MGDVVIFIWGSWNQHIGCSRVKALQFKSLHWQMTEPTHSRSFTVIPIVQSQTWAKEGIQIVEMHLSLGAPSIRSAGAIQLFYFVVVLQSRVRRLQGWEPQIVQSQTSLYVPVNERKNLKIVEIHLSFRAPSMRSTGAIQLFFVHSIIESEEYRNENTVLSNGSRYAVGYRPPIRIPTFITSDRRRESRWSGQTDGAMADRSAT